MLEVTLYFTHGLLFILLVVATRRLRTSFIQGEPPVYTSKLGQETDLPSVTVCIPARNEAHALIDCLQKVVASDYRKLEIIVLDDVSGDDTSALIKSFASEGVRFLQGSPLREGWLGKNHALEGLLQHASGTFILFMDVDTRLAPKAVENLVRHAVTNRLAMVSVLPRREDGLRGSVIASPLRYFWEVLFSRRLWPATASNAWLIRRDTLLDRFHGFEPLKAAVQPEAEIAAQLAKTNEYSFLIGTQAFGIGYEKKWRSQLITSVRLLYPLLNGKRHLMLAALANILLLLVPYIVIVTAILSTHVSTYVLSTALVVAIGYSMLYGYYAQRVWRRGSVIGACIWPLILIQEMVLIVSSAYQYRRKTVKWKGRLIQREVRK